MPARGAENDSGCMTATIVIIVLGSLAAASLVATVRALALDGYRRIPDQFS